MNSDRLRKVRAATGALVVGLVGVATLGLTVGPAAADDSRGSTVGVTYVIPARGTLDTPMTALTSAPCPAGDFFVVRLYGKGLGTNGANINGAMGIVGLPRTPTNQLYIQLSYVLRDFAKDDVRGGKMEGTYDVVVRCRKALNFTSLGDFVGRIAVHGNAYRAIGAAAVPKTYKGPSTPPPSFAAPSATAGGAQSGGTTVPGTVAAGSPSAVASNGSPSAPVGAGAGTSPAASLGTEATQGTSSSGGHSLRSKALLVGGLVLILGAAVLLLGDRLRGPRRPKPEPTNETESVDVRRPVKKP